MRKSAFTPLAEHFRRELVAMREKAGMTQRDLAKKLGREHSFVSRIEQGERRLDFVEAFWVLRALEQDPARVASELMREFGRLEGAAKAPSPKGRRRRRARG